MMATVVPGESADTRLKWRRAALDATVFVRLLEMRRKEEQGCKG